MNLVLTFLLSPIYFMYMQIFQNQKNKNKQTQIQNASSPKHFGKGILSLYKSSWGSWRLSRDLGCYGKIPGPWVEAPPVRVAPWDVSGGCSEPGLWLHAFQPPNGKDSFLGKMILLCSGLSLTPATLSLRYELKVSLLLTVLKGIRPS